MAAGRGDFEGSLCGRLPAHVTKIGKGFLCIERPAWLCRVAEFFAVAQCRRNRIVQRLDRVDADALDERRLRGVAARNEQCVESGVARADRHRQDAADGARVAVERELAEGDETLQRQCVDLFVDCEQGERDRQVEAGSDFANVGRREVHEHAAGRKLVAAIDERGAHPVARFAQCAIGQADDRESRRPGRAIRFDANDVAVDAEHRGGMGECEHANPPRDVSRRRPARLGRGYMLETGPRNGM